MYNNFFYSLRNKFEPFFNTRAKVKLFILGFGCSQVYVTGACVYLKVVNGLSVDSDNIDNILHHFYISDFATHLSPYMLPVFLRRGCMANIDKVLSDEKSNFSQRLFSYSALSKICENIHSINYVSKRYESDLENTESDLSQKMLPFKNLIDSLVEPKKLKTLKQKNNEGSEICKEVDESELLFDAKIRAVENLLKKLRPEERELSYDHISKLVKLNKKYKSVESCEKISKVLRLLLENDKNLEGVIDNEVENFNNFPIIKSSEGPVVNLEEQCPVLSYLYLYKFKMDYLKNVFSDKFYLISCNRDSINLINAALEKSMDSIPELLVPFQYDFWKKYIDEMKSVTMLFQASLMYTLVMSLFDKLPANQSRLLSLKNGVGHGLRSFRGLMLLELFFMCQKKFIGSKLYFDNENKGKAALLSFLVSLSTFGSLAVVCSTQRFFFGPFLLTRPIM